MKFLESLRRSNEEVRDERSELINSNARLAYIRYIEHLKTELKRLAIEQEELFDFHSIDGNNIVLGTNFNADLLVASDMNIMAKRLNIQIGLDQAEKRFAELFNID